MKIATIIPFCDKDAHLVEDAIESIKAQTINSKIYVIGDIVEYKSLDWLAKTYEKDGICFLRSKRRIGPYCITNSVVRFHIEDDVDYIALQDADDISYPHRFETQVIAMRGVMDHSSGPMKHIALPGYKGDRHLREPTLLCGVKARNVPLGRFINGTRMISVKLFKKLNGFPPIFCSGDICFDNTLQYLGVLTAVTDRVLGERRLHPDSLTNHPDTSREAPMRQACMNYLYKCLAEIQNKPTIKTAYNYGGLDEAEELEYLC